MPENTAFERTVPPVTILKKPWNTPSVILGTTLDETQKTNWPDEEPGPLTPIGPS